MSPGIGSEVEQGLEEGEKGGIGPAPWDPGPKPHSYCLSLIFCRRVSAANACATPFRFGDALSVSISVLVGTVTVQWDLPVCVCVGGYGVAAGCILVGNLGRLKGSKGIQVCFWAQSRY